MANVRIELKPYTDWAGQVRAPELSPADPRATFWRLNCGRLWDTLVVGAGGEVGLCCYDVEAQHGLGSAATESLADIWQSETMRTLREAQDRGRLAGLPLCGEVRDGPQIPR